MLLVAVIAYQVGVLVFSPLDRVFDTRKCIAIGRHPVDRRHPGRARPVGHGRRLWVRDRRRSSGSGFLSPCSTMVMAHGRGIFPDRLIGRGIATMNTCVMLGVACMQTLSGIIIGAFAPLRRRRPLGGRLPRAVRRHGTRC